MEAGGGVITGSFSRRRVSFDQKRKMEGKRDGSVMKVMMMKMLLPKPIQPMMSSFVIGPNR